MRFYNEFILIILATLFVVSCSSTGSQIVHTPGSGTQSVTNNDRQQVLEQQRTLAEVEEAERRAEEERLAQEARVRQEAETAARREAERQRELAAQHAAEQARMVAGQEARVEDLRAQIAATDQETANLETANSVMRQAVAVAEQLAEALMDEEEKYNNTDSVTGELLDVLVPSRLNELAEQVESLSNQAESLLAQP